MNKTLTDVLVIGAGPVGLFSVFELGQLGMKSCVVDSLDIIGGQCSSLYPEKPIYDIPAYPEISKIIKENDEFLVFTSNNKSIKCKCILIAAGNGAFGPNKPPLNGIEEYENKLGN